MMSTVNKVTATQAWQVFQQADCLYDQATVEQAIQALATSISDVLQHENPLVLPVMNGGLVLAGKLLTQLHFPLQLDYLHATRYRGTTVGQQRIHWLKEASISLKNRVVVLIDDILDEGRTLQSVQQYCRGEGARQVYSAVLLDKQHNRRVLDRQGQAIRADFVALSVPDRYVFGEGMDYHHYLRNVAGIYAVRQ